MDTYVNPRKHVIVYAFSLFIFFSSIDNDLYAQGGKVVPDDLDCRNLPAKYEQYREYCKNVDFIEHQVKKIEEKLQPNNDLEVVIEINTLKDKGWSYVKKKDYVNAKKYFQQAQQLNSQNSFARNQKYQSWDLTSIIKAVEAQNKIANSSNYDFWHGKPIEKEKHKEIITAKNADDSLKNAPWYNIKYECHASDAKGLEILQVVKSSDANSVEIEIKLKFNDLHPQYHRNILISRFTDFNKGDTERWIALLGAGFKNGTIWTSPETIRIPKKWSYGNYTAVWDDERQRYRLSKWPDETPYNRSYEVELFGVQLECYQYDDIEPEKWKKVIRLDR